MLATLGASDYAYINTYICMWRRRCSTVAFRIYEYLLLMRIWAHNQVLVAAVVTVVGTMARPS